MRINIFKTVSITVTESFNDKKNLRRCGGLGVSVTASGVWTARPGFESRPGASPVWSEGWQITLEYCINNIIKTLGSGRLYTVSFKKIEIFTRFKQMKPVPVIIKVLISFQITLFENAAVLQSLSWISRPFLKGAGAEM